MMATARCHRVRGVPLQPHVVRAIAHSVVLFLVAPIKSGSAPHGNSGACRVGLSCGFSRHIVGFDCHLKGTEAVFLGDEPSVLRVVDRADLIGEQRAHDAAVEFLLRHAGAAADAEATVGGK